MKLNNRGWSTSEMILLMSVLFIFFLIAVFFIIKLYSSFDMTPTGNRINESGEVINE